MGRRARSGTRILGAAVLGFLLLIVLGLPLYVFPPQEEVKSADVIYVLGPAMVERTALAEQLRNQGVASQILISISPPGDNPDAAIPPICKEQGVTCTVPDPLKTRGEAAMLTEYAKTHTVHRTVIITFAPQVMRARFIFAKCYGGDVSVVSVDQHLSARQWAYQYVYQTAGFLKAFVKSCPQ